MSTRFGVQNSIVSDPLYLMGESTDGFACVIIPTRVVHSSTHEHAL